MLIRFLISEGKGILSIPEKYMREFNVKLSEFYNTNDYSKIDSFIYDNCIHGLVLQQEKLKKMKMRMN